MRRRRFTITALRTVPLVAGVLCAACAGPEPTAPPTFSDLNAPADGASEPTTSRYRLDDRAGWSRSEESEPAPGSDAAEIRRARELLADERPSAALRLLDEFIERASSEGSRYFDEALLLRGDAKVARDEEFDALYDYERLIRSYPSSPYFVTAIERETRIADLYLEGLKLRFLGFRLIDGEDIAIELLIRAQERLPGSAIAERAAIRIADYYYAKREMRLARDAYDLYLANFPNGPSRVHAQRRLIYADMARFKGPRYDGSALLDVRLRIEDFAERFPNEAAASGINEGLIARIDESTAAAMLESARWYLNVDDPSAARYTLRRLLRLHPRTIAAQRARAIMDERGWTLPADDAPTDGGSTGVRIEGPLADDVEPVEEGDGGADR
jgi:outer membrane protein assembly factor BamD (BamD/ComL family)